MSVRNQMQPQQQEQQQKPALASSKAWVGKAKNGPLFPLGQLVATPAALDLLTGQGLTPLTLLVRHVAGDFGDLDDEDMQANRDAIEHGSRVFSSYALPAGKVWVITEADRSSTCVLMPSDY